MVSTFKDENRALQELAREIALLRKHNLQFKEGDPQGNMLMFAEAALTCLTMEHFVRVVLTDATERDALPALLQKAIGKGLIRLPWNDQAQGVEAVRKTRNTILHGNYAQAAREAGCASVRDYFRTQFAGEIEGMFKILDFIMAQIDPATGRPRETKLP